jgi:hypothetical protein
MGRPTDIEAHHLTTISSAPNGRYVAPFGLDFEPYSAALEDQFKVIIVPDALAPTTTRHTRFIGRRKWPHLGFAFL